VVFLFNNLEFLILCSERQRERERDAHRERERERRLRETEENYDDSVFSLSVSKFGFPDPKTNCYT